MSDGRLVACALLKATVMELVLQRYSWALMAAAVLIAAFLAARTVNTLAAQAIAPQ